MGNGNGNGNGLLAAEMISALEQAQGFVSKACDILRCSRTTWYRYEKKYITVQEKKAEIKDNRDDFVESQIMKKIKEGDTTMIIFYAKTQMKHRGYVERQEIAGVDNQPLVIINWDDETEP